MTPTRALLVVTMALAGLAVSGCRPTLQGLRSLDLVPEGSTVSGGMDLGRLRGSAALARLQAPGRAFSKSYPKLVRAVGFDPLRDVDQVRGTVPRTGSKGAFTLAVGRFDPGAAITRMNAFRRETRQPELGQLTYRQHRVYTVPERPESAFAFAGPTRLMGGPPTLVRLALQLIDRQGEANSPSARTVARVLKDRPAPPHTAWLDITVPPASAEAAKKKRQKPRPYRVTSARGTLDVTDGLAIDLRFKLRTAAEATLCADALRQEIAKLRDNALVQLAGYREYLDHITVEATGNEALAQARYSPALVGRLLDLIERGVAASVQRRSKPGAPPSGTPPDPGPSPSPSP